MSDISTVNSIGESSWFCFQIQIVHQINVVHKIGNLGEIAVTSVIQIFSFLRLVTQLFYLSP